MTTRIEHPNGLPPPEEWVQTGRAKAWEFREWLALDKPKQKRSKFGANAGTRPDLGIYLKSSLENNCLRLLLFQGYQLWREKEDPPSEGKWVRYEGRRYKFTLKPGTDSERTLNYLPDFHLWDGGLHRVWEAKGHLDARSKRLLRLMGQFYPEIQVDLITVEELNARKTAVLYEARRSGLDVREVPGWE